MEELSTKPYLDCENYYLTNLSIAVRSGPMRTWDYELSLLEFESMLDELMMARTTVRVALVLVERVAMLVAQFLKEKNYESSVMNHTMVNNPGIPLENLRLSCSNSTPLRTRSISPSLSVTGPMDLFRPPGIPSSLIAENMVMWCRSWLFDLTFAIHSRF